MRRARVAPPPAAARPRLRRPAVGSERPFVGSRRARREAGATVRPRRGIESRPAMMWLVRMALKRPYTFVVMAMLIIVLGGLTIARMPTDIFPDIDIPVISVIWAYSGLSPEEMEKRIVNNYERNLTVAVNDIE